MVFPFPPIATNVSDCHRHLKGGGHVSPSRFDFNNAKVFNTIPLRSSGRPTSFHDIWEVNVARPLPLKDHQRTPLHFLFMHCSRGIRCAWQMCAEEYSCYWNLEDGIVFVVCLNKFSFQQYNLIKNSKIYLCFTGPETCFSRLYCSNELDTL